MTEALKFGIDVIDQAFEKLDSHVADSDSEDEESTYKVDPILEAKVSSFLCFVLLFLSSSSSLDMAGSLCVDDLMCPLCV